MANSKPKWFGGLDNAGNWIPGDEKAMGVASGAAGGLSQSNWKPNNPVSSQVPWQIGTGLPGASPGGDALEHNPFNAPAPAKAPDAPAAAGAKWYGGPDNAGTWIPGDKKAMGVASGAAAGLRQSNWKPNNPVSSQVPWQIGTGLPGSSPGGDSIEHNPFNAPSSSATPSADDRLTQALNGVGPVVRSDAEIADLRRSAFLNSKDSMSGIRAVKEILADEVTRRGGTPAAAHQQTVKGLEAQIANARPAEGLGYNSEGQWTTSNDKAGEDATLNAMSFAKHPMMAPAAETPAVAQAPAVAPPGGLPQLMMNDYMQSDPFKTKLRTTDQPLNEIAKWQVHQLPTSAPREEAGREARLAAFAAQGEAPPQAAGEAVLAVGAGSPFGTRGGQFKPGNTMQLPMLDPSQLPPRFRYGYQSGPSIMGY